MVSKPARVTAMAKAAAAIKELRKALLSGNLRKVIIFTVNRNVNRYVREYLRDLNAISLFGNMSQEKKERFINKFRKYHSFRVLVCNHDVGEIDGIQDACNHVVFIQAS